MQTLHSVDWVNFLHATQAFLHGQNPYLVGTGYDKVYEPFWTFILLAPFTLFPAVLGRILFAIVGFLSYAVTAIKLGAKSWQLALFLLSSCVIGTLYYGNIDWLVLLGLWMPPWLGLFLVLMKPQLGLCIALYWAYIAWREGGWRKVVTTFAPVTIAYLLSFGIYGFWLFQFRGMPANPYNFSTFPYLVPIALFLLYEAVNRRDKNLSMFSTPLIAPYTNMWSYSVSLLALLDRPALFIAFWIGMWIPSTLNALLHP